ncbi:MAG: ABC transporter permease [Planctomycetaceae bacterium]|nr:ABC transporter permease [Planctomycetaceae bacterium]
MNRAELISRIARQLPWLLLALAAGILLLELRRPSDVLLFWPAWAETGMLAAGLTLVMLTGGIDLSVGAIVALASMALGLAWQQWDWSIESAALLAIAVGFVCGAWNGGLVIGGISPLVATLATMACYAGGALALSGGERVAGLPNAFTALGNTRWLGIPSQVWWMLALFAVASVFVHGTRWGRYLYALGDNPTAARFAALPVKRLLWSIYAASGCVAGMVAVAYTARSGAATPTSGVGRELEAIACVVLGGTRVTGGAGGMGRTLLGVIVLAHLDIALQLAGSLNLRLPGMEAAWQPSAESRQIILGLLVIGMAIWNERLARRREALA